MKKGYQRRRFMGYILDSSNHIQRAFACGIQSGKTYCLEDSKDGTAFESNIVILNQVFSYVSVHYKENCHIFDSRSNYEMYCY